MKDPTLERLLDARASLQAELERRFKSWLGATEQRALVDTINEITRTILERGGDRREAAPAPPSPPAEPPPAAA